MAQVKDATGYLLSNTTGPGDRVKRVQQTRPSWRLTPSQSTFLDKWRTPSDKTIGWVSNALAYGTVMNGSKPAYHTNMIRLIKGGHIVACEVAAPPLPGSHAHRDSPYGQKFYFLRAGHSCPTEIEPGAATFQGARRKRR